MPASQQVGHEVAPMNLRRPSPAWFVICPTSPSRMRLENSRGRLKLNSLTLPRMSPRHGTFSRGG